MDQARPVIATILAMGFVMTVIIQEYGDRTVMDEALECPTFHPTLLLFVLAIIILTIPDVLGYLFKKKGRNDD